jgi:hypothetical protein
VAQNSNQNRGAKKMLFLTVLFSERPNAEGNLPGRIESLRKKNEGREKGGNVEKDKEKSWQKYQQNTAASSTVKSGF